MLTLHATLIIIKPNEIRTKIQTSFYSTHANCNKRKKAFNQPINLKSPHHGPHKCHLRHRGRHWRRRDLPRRRSPANRAQFRRPITARMDLPNVVLGLTFMCLAVISEPILRLQNRASYHNPNHRPSCHPSHRPFLGGDVAGDSVQDSRMWVEAVFA